MGNKGILAGIAIAGVAAVSAAVVIIKKDEIFPPGPGPTPGPDPGPEPGPQPEPEIILIRSLSVNPKSGNKPLTVGFVLDVKGVPEVIEWTFGDGQVEIGSFSKSHTYFSAGTFNGKVKVTNKDGISDQKSFSITVNETDPGPGPGPQPEPQDIITNFFQSKATVVQNQSAAFSIALGEPFSNIREIRWHFGDATPDIVGSSNNELSVDHIYSKEGSFSGNVTVKTNDGRSETRRFFMSVQGDPTSNITAKIILSGFSGSIDVGEQFRAFIDRGGGVPPFTYKMDYGDGTILFQQDSFHSYAAGGNYTLKATVIDSQGNQVTATRSISVNVAPLQVGDVVFTNAPNETSKNPVNILFLSNGQSRLFFDGFVKNNRTDRSVSVKSTAIVKQISTNKTLITKDSSTVFITPGGTAQLSGFIIDLDPFGVPYEVTTDLDDATGELTKDLDFFTQTL